MKTLIKLSAKIPLEVKYILLLFLATRLTLTLIGVASRVIIGTFDVSEVGPLDVESRPVQGAPLRFSNELWLDLWGQWDSAWYKDIAEEGYSPAVSPKGEANYVFFPLFPGLAKTVGAVFGGTFAGGLIVSNLALLFAAYFLYKLLRLDEDQETSLRAVKYLFLYPTAFIFSGFLTESLFLALLLGCFYLGRQKLWHLVGSFGFFLALTRLVGVLAFFPFLFEYLKQKDFKLSQIKPSILYLSLIPVGLAFFLFLNYSLTGDPLAFINRIGVGWGRTFGNPFEPFFAQGISLFSGRGFSAIFALTAFSALIAFARKVRFSYLLLGLLFLLTPLATDLLGMPRYISVIFPLYIIAAKVLKNPQLDQTATILLALFQGFLMVLWSTGHPLIQ